MNTQRRLAAACLLLAALTPLAACGLNAAGDPADGPASVSTVPDSGPPAPASAVAPAFGTPHTYPDGLTVTVSRPTSFTPSRTASPHVEHAVSFELTVINGTERPYRLSRLALQAEVNGMPSREVVDPTQGYTGKADTELPPSRSVTVLLAFGGDNWPSAASLRVSPGHPEDASTEFTGPVSG